MTSLFHMVPSKMEGTTLYPLNQLRSLYPDLYKEAATKYIQRPEVAAEKIPLLGNCLWGDVVFLTPIHPTEMRRALAKAGFRKRYALRFFEIDCSKLDREQLCLFASPTGLPSSGRYVSFEMVVLEHMRRISQRTVEYYRQNRLAGRVPLLHHLVPQILYKGQIDVLNTKIVS